MKSILILFIATTIVSFSQEINKEIESNYHIEIMNKEVKDDYVRIIVLSEEGEIVKVLRTQFIDGLSSFELEIMKGLYTMQYFYEKIVDNISYSNKLETKEMKEHNFELNLDRNKFNSFSIE